MHNPIKGQVNLEIRGVSYPLIFSFDAIAKIEAEFDASILHAQLDVARIGPMFHFLEAALNEAFTLDELKSLSDTSELPPYETIIIAIKESLNVAYFGGEVVDDEPDQPTDEKKKRWYYLWMA